MGQYFRAVNVTKQEYVSPWDMGFGAKLWEWCANRSAGIFPYLLRKSSSGGGGDIQIDGPGYAGRWAGDEVYLVGGTTTRASCTNRLKRSSRTSPRDWSRTTTGSSSSRS